MALTLSCILSSIIMLFSHLLVYAKFYALLCRYCRSMSIMLSLSSIINSTITTTTNSTTTTTTTKVKTTDTILWSFQLKELIFIVFTCQPAYQGFSRHSYISHVITVLNPVETLAKTMVSVRIVGWVIALWPSIKHQLLLISLAINPCYQRVLLWSHVSCVVVFLAFLLFTASRRKSLPAGGPLRYPWQLFIYWEGEIGVSMIVFEILVLFYCYYYYYYYYYCYY